VPKTIRSRASALLPRYPIQEGIEQLLVENTRGLPEHWANVLCESLQRFLKAQWSCRVSEQTQRSLLYTLRHFPSYRTIVSVQKSDDLSRWLRPEDPRKWKC
jgi:hypothetical protein